MSDMAGVLLDHQVHETRCNVAGSVPSQRSLGRDGGRRQHCHHDDIDDACHAATE